jgi:AcrR family transcriptional regulator
MQTSPFLIQSCLNIFFTQGVKVSVDDIAKELCISKRTLYEIFENKSELIYQCILHLVEEEKTKMTYYLSKDGGNVIEKLFPFLNIEIYSSLKEHHCFFLEIKRYYPEIFEKLVMTHINAYLEYIDTILKEGIERNIFRNDIQAEIVKVFFFFLMTTQNNNSNNKSLFQRYSVVEIFENTILCYIRGISTSKGLKLIDDVLQRSHQYFENNKINCNQEKSKI